MPALASKVSRRLLAASLALTATNAAGTGTASIAATMLRMVGTPTSGVSSFR